MTLDTCWASICSQASKYHYCSCIVLHCFCLKLMLFIEHVFVSCSYLNFSPSYHLMWQISSGKWSGIRDVKFISVLRDLESTGYGSWDFFLASSELNSCSCLVTILSLYLLLLLLFFFSSHFCSWQMTISFHLIWKLTQSWSSSETKKRCKMDGYKIFCSRIAAPVWSVIAKNVCKTETMLWNLLGMHLGVCSRSLSMVIIIFWCIW